MLTHLIGQTEDARFIILTKEFEYDCEIRGKHKNVQVRKATIVKDDGVEIRHISPPRFALPY